MSTDRATELVDLLQLRPHPEGGSFAEVFRSPASVAPLDGRPPRAALTTIYFLLRAGEHSALHAVASDEAWHYYEGDPLELVWCDPSFDVERRARLGRAGSDMQPVEVVPAGWWQAARTTGDYTLVGCTVGPGFDFADFRMLAGSADEPLMRASRPGLTEWL